MPQPQRQTGAYMKKLGIVTHSTEVGKAYQEQILKIFDHRLEVETYSFELNNFEGLQAMDTILISTYSQYGFLKSHVNLDNNIVIAKLTLSQQGYQKMKDCIGKFKKAMLVNLSLEMSLETIALLYQLGFDQFEFVPVYPRMETIPDLDVAVTTGERRFVPERASIVYDLGHRLIDKSTIVEIAVGLGLEDLLRDRSVTDYFDSLFPFSKGVEYLLGKSNIMKDQFDTLLGLMDKGVIGVDRDNIIRSCNGNAEKIVNIPKSDLLGYCAQEVLPEIDFNDCPVSNKLAKIRGTYITFSIYPMLGMGDSRNGAYAIIENFESKENIQNKLRLQLMNKGHQAKYHLEDIIGESPKIKEVRELAARMAKSRSSVLITGESGTGKELAAQAIHNLSADRDKHFVAINCAALSPSLLESELFGYEKGAFTGASKDGKEGIFEIANNGTLFLDEIGEMPLELQAKLLRVIQEREIMRVGGDRLIKINVRIIAATNIDLAGKVEKGEFRKDLYYRLNVLPIHIPPLRERREDIEVLLKYFMKKNEACFELLPETQRYLKEYNWSGNIRELLNCVEYLDNLGKEAIQIEDLPYPMKAGAAWPAEMASHPEAGGETVFGGDKERLVLELLYKSFLEHQRMGRKSLSLRASAAGYFLSEHEIKRILKELARGGFIESAVGRGGSCISRKGIQRIQNG
jgi:transcriptional regulator with PAS, ATPase and Fis domain